MNEPRRQRIEFRSDLSGIVVVNKEAGLTSFAVVKALKMIFKVKKVGHTGTLDPFATGVLPVCINKATRFAGLVTDFDKVYRAKIRLGAESDTYDRTGVVTEHNPARFPTPEELNQALDAFRGKIRQTPPIYSAIKVDGKPLYERARAGEAFDLTQKIREVTIYDLKLNSYEPPFVDLTVRASKGTYLRSIAHDLGKNLGTGGLLESLVREAVGPLMIEKAFFLKDLEAAVGPMPVDSPISAYSQWMFPSDDLVAAIPEIKVNRADFLELSDGRITDPGILLGLAREHKNEAVADILQSGGVLRATEATGRGTAIIECQHAEGQKTGNLHLRPFRILQKGERLF